MKLILLEAISPDITKFILHFKDNANELSKYFDTKRGKFKSVNKFISVLMSTDRRDLLYEAIRLCEIESSFSEYLSQFLEAALKLQFPKLTQDEMCLNMLLSSLLKDGYDLLTDRIYFENDFFNRYLNDIEDIASTRNQVAQYLLPYLYINYYKKNILDEEDVNQILEQNTRWFKSNTKYDTKYKLDTFVWLLSGKADSYGIDGLTPYTLVDPKSRSYGLDVSNGVEFLQLDTNDIQKWLALFTEEKKRKLTLLYYWDNLDPAIMDYKDVYKKYKSEFDKIDISASNKVFEYLKTLTRREWPGKLKKIVFLKNPDVRMILKGLIQLVEEETSSTEEASGTTSETSVPEKRISNSTLKKPLSGVGALKKVLNLKRNPTVGELKLYTSTIALKYKLKNKLSKINWAMFINRLDKPLKYSSSIKGSEQLALDELIVKLLQKY